MNGDLNNHHRDTLRKLFSHPASGNLEWRQVLSLLEAVGTVSEDHNGKVKVTLGPETEILSRRLAAHADERRVFPGRRATSGRRALARP
jgi:hypothetical protein